MSVVIKIALMWQFFCQKRLGWVQKTQLLNELELEFSKTTAYLKSAINLLLISYKNSNLKKKFFNRCVTLKPIYTKNVFSFFAFQLFQSSVQYWASSFVIITMKLVFVLLHTNF